MNIIKYDPFREMRNLQDEVNRLFASNFLRGGENDLTRGAWSPQVDIFENKDQIVLEAELPGVQPDAVDISIENNVLTLRGERKFEKKDEGDNFHRVERSYGSFTRSFTLPSTVSSENANAEFENGILRLILAKREETKPRRIEIKAGSGNAQPKTIDAGADQTKQKAHTANG
jgi:HSP20 family protein